MRVTRGWTGWEDGALGGGDRDTEPDGTAQRGKEVPGPLQDRPGVPRDPPGTMQRPELLLVLFTEPEPTRDGA